MAFDVPDQPSGDSSIEARVERLKEYTLPCHEGNVALEHPWALVDEAIQGVGTHWAPYPVETTDDDPIALTQAGEILRSRAEQVLAIVEVTRAQISHDDESGRIRVGAIPTSAPYFLPAVLRRFAREQPQASIVVPEDTSGNLLKSCSDGEIDVAIPALQITAKHLDVESEPLVMLREAHGLSDQIATF